MENDKGIYCFDMVCNKRRAILCGIPVIEVGGCCYMVNKKDLKYYLLLTSSSFLNILRFSPRIHILPSVIIYPSNVCNYDCVMCTNARNKNKNHKIMDWDLMEKNINECSNFIIKPRIHFSGLGEPLIYSKIKDAMQLCRKNKLRWSMTTNGYFLENYANDLILNNCSAINVSIHGCRSEHDKITGIKGNFDKVINGIKILDETKKRFKKTTPLISINCVFNNDNILNLKKILNIFMKLPINGITFQHMIFNENEKDVDFLIKDKDKIKSLVKFVEFIETNKFPIKVNLFPKIKRKDIIRYYTTKNKFKQSCIFPWLSVRIHPNGEVKSCFQTLGNTKYNSLKSIINSCEALRIRNLLRRGKFRISSCFRCCHKQYY